MNSDGGDNLMYQINYRSADTANAIFHLLVFDDITVFVNELDFFLDVLLSITSLSKDLPAIKYQIIGEKVRETAMDISREMGYDC
jgi:hypothetical protein